MAGVLHRTGRVAPGRAVVVGSSHQMRRSIALQAILGSLLATARRAAHHRGRSLALLAVFAACAAWPAAAGSATLPPGFQERIVFSGLTNPMAVAFAGDGRVFVGQKNGQIKVFDSLTDTTPTIFADLRTGTYDNW